MTTSTELPAVICGDCGAPMKLRTARKGRFDGKRFWGCSTWPKCDSTHGAHPDGRPLGIPGDKATKAARIRAHEAFDKLWAGGEMSRGGAYRWMRRALGLTEEQAHIGRFTIADCDRLIAALAAHAPTSHPLSPRGDVATEAEERGEREDLDGWKAIGDYDTSGMDLPDDH